MLAQLRAGKSSKSKLLLAKFKSVESLDGWEVRQGTYFQDDVAAKYDGGMDAKFEFTESGDAVFSGVIASCLDFDYTLYHIFSFLFMCRREHDKEVVKFFVDHFCSQDMFLQEAAMLSCQNNSLSLLVPPLTGIGYFSFLFYLCTGCGLKNDNKHNIVKSRMLVIYATL